MSNAGVVNISGFAEAIQVGAPIVAKVFAWVDDINNRVVLKSKSELSVRDVSDLITAYALAKREPHESVAQSLGRLGVENDAQLNKLMRAQHVLKLYGSEGGKAVPIADVEKTVVVKRDEPRMVQSPYGHAYR